MVIWGNDQNPTGEQRRDWVQKTFPTVNVMLAVDLFTDEADKSNDPEQLEKSSRMWAIYAEDMLNGDVVDVIFSSEAYGERWARYMGVPHKLVDMNRTYLPISGTDIRSDPYLYWQYINRYARQHYLKRVLVVGPESTGKTTLCRNLSNLYGTVYSPEYGRIYDEQTRKPKAEFNESRWRTIYAAIVNEQPKLDRRAEEDARMLCFYDTDLHTTSMWYEEWQKDYGHDGLYQSIIAAAEKQPKYDLVLLQDLAPWVDDGMRGQTEDVRQKFYKNLFNYHWDKNEFVILSGSWEEREAKAIQTINRVCFPNTKATLPRR
jgi:NadR type nicotinamide-nucleotide adenylyltransferase